MVENDVNECQSEEGMQIEESSSFCPPVPTALCSAHVVEFHLVLRENGCAHNSI